MKLNILWVELAVGIYPAFAREAAGNTIAISTLDWPPCTLDCLNESVPVSNCTNSVCACELDDAVDAAASCLRAGCSYSEILTVKNITNPACHGHISPRDRSTEYLALNLALGLVNALLTTARLIYKRRFSPRRRLDPDDWVILSAISVGFPSAIINRQGLIHNGLGKDAWTLGLQHMLEFAMYFYVLEILYLTAITLVKLTLLVFYLRIFPRDFAKRWTRELLWATIVFNIVLGVTCIFLAVFQCSPVSYYWKQYDTAASGTCLPSTPIAWVNAALNVALDVWMILIPLREVWVLRLHWKKKIGVVLMFLMGTFVTVVSILRLLSLSRFSQSINITWDYYGIAWWSTIEINVGIICTSLPTLRLILVRMSPRIFDSQGVGQKSKSKSNSNKTSFQAETVAIPVVEHGAS